MARNLLTALEIKASTRPKLRDGDGLWLHTGKSGNRSWVFIYVRHGRRREMGLGRLADVNLASARAKASEARSILAKGGDPFKEMTERKARVKPMLFGEMVRQYIETMSPKWRGSKTLPAWELFAKTYARPLRNVTVAELSTDDVVRVLRPLWHSKPETASKVRERIKLVLDHARARGLRSGDNPAQWKGHLDQILPTQDALARGHHAALPYKDAPAFMKRLRGTQTTTAMALEFLILTATRSGEARLAVWDEFDLDGALWIVPAARMKTQKLHRVPLSDRAVGIVKVMREQSLTDLVFPGARPDRPFSDMTFGKVIEAHGGGGATTHGFRSSFRDWAADETDHQREIIEAALAHAVGDSVERAYRRGDALEKRRALMADWSAYLNTGK